MELDNSTYKLAGSNNIGKYALIVAIIGIVLSMFGYFIDPKQFFHSYLVAFIYWLSIGLGGLFFVMLHHLTNATWSIVLRRLIENIMVVISYMAVFAVILVLGIGELYHWSHSEIVNADHLLKGKQPYLNMTFFIVRLIIYFIIWFILSRKLFKVSLQQDNAFNNSQDKRFKRISAPGMILFALTITFAAFDWLMSLDAYWYSTIFGVYIFAGAVVGLISFVIILVMYLHNCDILRDKITVEHFHDLGKLLFAFLVFWAYMAFSQYLLIWYGNIPEETIWFLHRWEGSWKIVTLLLVFGHFVIPFFILFPHAAKRNKIIMTVMACWILLMHWIDLYWLVMPSLHPHSAHISWMDLTSMVGIGGVFIWLFWHQLHKRAILPVNDPRLEKSIKFINS